MSRTIDLAPFQPYVDPTLNLGVTAGAVSAKGVVDFDLPPGAPPKVGYAGDLNITDFASVDKPRLAGPAQVEVALRRRHQVHARAAPGRGGRGRALGVLLAPDHQRRWHVQPPGTREEVAARICGAEAGGREGGRRHRGEDRRGGEGRDDADEHLGRQDHAAGRQHQLQRLLRPAELLGEPDRRRRQR